MPGYRNHTTAIGLATRSPERSSQKFPTAAGPVAMVGDGVNDAPALAVATVGSAMGAISG